MYKLQNDPKTGLPYAVLKDDVLSIPFAPDNTDYQAYLRWCEEGNVAEPADLGE